MQCAVLNQNSCEVTASFIQRGFNNGARSSFLWIRFQFKKVCFQQNLFEQLFHIGALLGRYLLALIFATPVFNQDVHIGQLFAYLFRISAGFVNFINGKNHWDTGCSRVVYCFDGLWHNGVIGSNNDNGEVCYLCSPGTHGCKCLVSRRIEKSDKPSVIELHTVSSNMLGYASGLTGNYIGIPYMVKQRCFSMIYVSHDCDNRRAFAQIAGLVFFLLNVILQICCNKFHLKSEFLGN